MSITVYQIIFFLDRDHDDIFQVVHCIIWAIQKIIGNFRCITLIIYIIIINIIILFCAARYVKNKVQYNITERASQYVITLLLVCLLQTF